MHLGCGAGAATFQRSHPASASPRRRQDTFPASSRSCVSRTGRTSCASPPTARDNHRAAGWSQGPDRSPDSSRGSGSADFCADLFVEPVIVRKYPLAGLRHLQRQAADRTRQSLTLHRLRLDKRLRNPSEVAHKFCRSFDLSEACVLSRGGCRRRDMRNVGHGTKPCTLDSTV